MATKNPSFELLADSLAKKKLRELREIYFRLISNQYRFAEDELERLLKEIDSVLPEGEEKTLVCDADISMMCGDIDEALDQLERIFLQFTGEKITPEVTLSNLRKCLEDACSEDTAYISWICDQMLQLRELDKNTKSLIRAQKKRCMINKSQILEVLKANFRET